MPSFNQLPLWYKVTFWVAVILVANGLLSVCYGDETTDRRVKIALSLFPKIVAVDEKFHLKLTRNNKVRLSFVYDRNKDQASQLAKAVKANNANIVNIEVKAVPLQVEKQLQSPEKPTAIFVAELLGEADFKDLIDYGINNGILVFSPYSGDVERGATVGLAITSRVFPYFNRQTLEASEIEINPILLDMSKYYE
ncbi:MAG: hypothetical protein PVG89_00035 [Gammaproteobacteria bacterium]|jgi:hypothetical protein